MSRRFGTASLGWITLFSIAGTAFAEGTDAFEKRINEYADAVSDAERILQQYGTISVSAPLLVAAPNKESPFAFDLKRDADDNFKDAQAVRSIRQSLQEQTQTVAALTAKALFAPELVSERDTRLEAAREASATRARALALKREAIDFRRKAAIAEIPANATQEERDKAVAAAEAKARDDEAQLLLDSVKDVSDPKPTELSDPGDPNDLKSAARTDFLRNDLKAGRADGLGETALPTRAALITAAGDTATQGLLSVLGNPAKYTEKGKHVFFGVAMVNVDPGWKTKKGYVAEVSVQINYIQNGASVPNNVRRFSGISQKVDLTQDNGPSWKVRRDVAPLVVAVSPMTDIQSTELDSGVHRRAEYSLALAASLAEAGLKKEAKVFSSFAKQLNSNIGISDYQASVTAYSLSGGIFGFRVGPRVEATIAPGGKQTKSRIDHRLQRVSFPVLVMVVFDDEDINTLKKTSGNSADFAIEFVQSSRWISETHWLGRLNWGFMRTRLRESTVAHYLTRVEKQTKQLLSEIDNLGSDSVGRDTAATLLSRGKNITSLLGGSQHWQSIPESLWSSKTDADTPKEELKPELVRIIPNSVQVNEAGVVEESLRIVILGKDLAGDWSAEWLNTISAPPALQPQVLGDESGDTALVVQLSKGSAPALGANAFKFVLKGEGGPKAVLWSPPITVSKPKPGTPPPPQKDRIELTKRTTSEPGKTVEAYSAPAESPELLGKLVEKDKQVVAAPHCEK